MDATRTALVVVGAVAQLVGILLVAWPDVLPYAERMSLWLGRLLAALGWSRAHVYVDAASGMLSLSSGSVSGLVSFDPNAPLEERVAYLLRQEQDAQARLNAHDERLRAIEEGMPKQLDELRAETKEHVSEVIVAAETRYRPLRFLGALLLAAGLTLTTIEGLL